MRQLFQYDPTIGHRFVPGLRTRVPHEGGGYLVRVNTAGFRSEHEVVRERPPGKRRILLFGDSFTAGDGVSNRDRYGDVLEKMLGDVEVQNFALSGSGTDQQYLIWREYADVVDHDLVLVGVLVENIRRIAARMRMYEDDTGRLLAYPKPYFELNAGRLDLRNVPVPRDPIPLSQLSPEEARHTDTGGSHLALRQMVGKLGERAKTLLQKATSFQPLPAYGDPAGSEWLLMREILAQWSRESVAPLVVALLPLYHYVEEISDPASYQSRFREFAEESGTIVHDVLPALRSLPPDQRRALRFQTDVHPTPLAHRMIAESLLHPVRAALGDQS